MKQVEDWPAARAIEQRDAADAQQAASQIQGPPRAADRGRSAALSQLKEELN